MSIQRNPQTRMEEQAGPGVHLPPSEDREDEAGPAGVATGAHSRRCEPVEPRSYELHVICQTHWDREWRLPFQQTRLMLADMMDHLLDLMRRDPGLRCFHLDGQTILLEDYIAIRPERRAELAALIGQGRLLAGPWYTLPEENLVCGECLVRNLLMGHQVAREFGGVMKAGFTPSSYGQVAQMPQIWAGFGIDSVFFHRGVPAHEVPLEYLWEGSDGSRVVALRPPLGGRFNFTTVVTNPLFTAADGGRIPYSEVPADDLAHSINLKAADNGNEVYYSTRVPQSWDKGTLQRVVRRLRSLAAANARTPYLYCGEGHDWMELNPLLPALVTEARSLLGRDTVLISSLPELFARIKRDLVRPPVLRGEMRSTQKDESGARLYSATLSGRIPIKQMNRKVEEALIRWAEPFSTIAWTLGTAYPETAMRKAWKNLLANHAHDSIVGSGIDQVHSDVMSRFAQCGLTADELTRRSLAHIVSSLDSRQVEDRDVRMTVFNPLPFPRDEVLRLDIDLPEADSSGFRLCDAAGNEVTCHRDAPLKAVHTVQQTHGFPYRFSAVRHRLWVRAESIPALGYRTYVVKRGSEAGPSLKPSGHEDRVVITGASRMENRWLAVEVNSNGTLTLQDKQTGRRYENLHEFEDVGEVGDAYEHKQPADDKIVTSRHKDARVELIHHNPLTASFRLHLSLKIPECATEDKHTRVSRHHACEVISFVTLAAGTRVVDIVTHVHNSSRDHRLRVLFPTGLRTGESWAQTPFDVQRRSMSPPPGDDWLEPPSTIHPQLNFVDLSDGRAGLAVINQGLPEYEVLADDQRTIAITLLRCFTHETRATRMDDPYQIGAQCQGPHEFRYALYPHEGDWRRGKVFREAYRHLHPLKVVQSWANQERPSATEPLPLEMSFLELDPDDLVLSAVKRSESGRSMVVRFFNPTDRAIEGNLRVHRPVAAARYLDLEENPLGECPIVGASSLRVAAGPKKIVTVGLDQA